MEKFVARHNIEHLRELLSKEKDEAKRQVLLDILAKEEAALALLTKNPKTG
jgi:hypothetical protein